MKIVSIEAIPISIPNVLSGPPTADARTDWGNMDYLIVKIETDEGITGWGEAFGYNSIPATKSAIDYMVAPLLLGRDPTQRSVLLDDIQRTLHLSGRYGITIFALSGIDIALWDLAGKIAGLPVAHLLGGMTRERVPAYASLLKYQNSKVVSEIASGVVMTNGYRAVKVHETGLDQIAATRDAIGDDVTLMVDINCVWTPQQALAMARQFSQFDIHWYEEPVWPPEDFDGLKRLRDFSPIPIAAGENACTAFEFHRMLKVGAVDIVQPSVTKVGGITEFVKVIHLAEAHNVHVAPHSPYFGPGLLATIQLIAARPAIEALEVLHVQLEKDLFGGAVDVVDGTVAVPTGPGLGLDPDPDVIDRYRRASAAVPE